MYTQESLKDLTVKELREILRGQGLTVSGTEQVLIDRILEAQTVKAGSADADQADGKSPTETSSESETPAEDESKAEGSGEEGTEGNAPPSEAATETSSESETPAEGDSTLNVDSQESAPNSDSSISDDSSVSGDENLSSSDPDSASNPNTPQPPSSHGADEGVAELETVDTSNSLFLYKPKSGQDIGVGGGVPGRGMIVRGDSPALDMYLGAYLEKTEVTEEEAEEHAATVLAEAEAAAAAAEVEAADKAE